MWSPIWMAYISLGEFYWFWYCMLWSCQNQMLYMSQLDCVFTHCVFGGGFSLFGYCKMLCMSCVRCNFVILLQKKKKFVFRFVVLFPVCSALACVCFFVFFVTCTTILKLSPTRTHTHAHVLCLIYKELLRDNQDLPDWDLTFTHQLLLLLLTNLDSPAWQL